MKSLTDQLPPEIARKIHPDWRKNEAAYWAARVGRGKDKLVVRISLLKAAGNGSKHIYGLAQGAFA